MISLYLVIKWSYSNIKCLLQMCTGLLYLLCSVDTAGQSWTPSPETKVLSQEIELCWINALRNVNV